MLAADDIGDIYMNITRDITAFITVQAYPNTAKIYEFYAHGSVHHKTIL
jgi:hypothetical protein